MLLFFPCFNLPHPFSGSSKICCPANTGQAVSCLLGFWITPNKHPAASVVKHHTVSIHRQLECDWGKFNLTPLWTQVWIVSGFLFTLHWLLPVSSGVGLTFPEHSLQLSPLNKSLRGARTTKHGKNVKNAWLLLLLHVLVPAVRPHPFSWGYYKTRYWPQIGRIRQAVWLLKLGKPFCKCVICLKPACGGGEKQSMWLLCSRIFSSHFFFCRWLQTVCLPSAWRDPGKVEVSEAVCAVLTQNTSIEWLFIPTSAHSEAIHADIHVDSHSKLH